jgi:hypothetical protein
MLAIGSSVKKQATRFKAPLSPSPPSSSEERGIAAGGWDESAHSAPER